MTTLQVKLKDKIKGKDLTNTSVPAVEVTVDLPVEEFEIIEEQMAEETMILNEEEYQVDDLSEAAPEVLAEEIQEIEKNISYFENEQLESQDEDEEINYDDYDDYYNQDK